MNRTARLALFALASLTLPACVGGPTDETDNGLVFHGPPLTPTQVCKASAPDAVYITGFDTGPQHTANGVAYEVMGDPMTLEVRANTNWTSSISKQVTVNFDGVSYPGVLSNSNNTQFAPSPSPILTPSTPLTHSFFIDTSCGRESATVTITPVAPTAPRAVLSASSTSVVTGTALQLSDGNVQEVTTSMCLFSGHLVGRNVGDRKVVLDEPMPTGFLFSSSSKGLVKPIYDTEYTIEEYCRSNPAIKKSSASVIVKTVAASTPVCSTLGTWSFCRQCPEGISGFPPQPVTVTETACGPDQALAMAKADGDNCAYQPGVCP
jgi:hypothetical protein